MDEKVKDLLKRLVNELEDLRANLVVLNQIAVTRPTSIADAQDRKQLATQASKAAYDVLRKEIDAL